MADQTAAHYIGTYSITGRLGEGSFGEVYSAYQPFLDRQVAVKTLHKDVFETSLRSTSTSEQMFMREARTIARLRHPNIVNIYEFGVAQDSQTNERSTYMVMEYLPGPALDARLMNGPLPVEETVRLVEQIAQGLMYAHEHNIVHRDLKPSNILFTASDEPVIVDFGLAKLAEEHWTETRVDGISPELGSQPSGVSTVSGEITGTPKYMAPEQLLGDPVSGATDQYALALMAGEMLTGRVPLDAETIIGLANRRLNASLPSTRTLVPELPPAVDPVLRRALQADPAARFENVVHFAQAFGDSLLPDRVHSQVVRVVDPFQMVALRTAHRYVSRFLLGLGLVTAIAILYCVVAFIRAYAAGSQPDFLWDGLIVSNLPQPDGSRVVNGIFPGSVAESAGYRVGDRIDDDLVLDVGDPDGVYQVNGVTRSSLNVDWKPRPYDVIQRPVRRGSSTVTLSYTLERNPYMLWVLSASLFGSLISVASGLWLLRHWGAEPGIQIHVPLCFLFGLFIIARAVTNIIPYLDTLTFHLTLAGIVHLILVFPTEAGWVKRHPQYIWWIYAPAVVGLYSLLTQSQIVVP
ncbi:MAG TPA: protein kinase, partial [Aggregatilineales bacterium]|nr:protein kinase [Aggregatilineales bacterium]